jgi:hypothetical protein
MGQRGTNPCQAIGDELPPNGAVGSAITEGLRVKIDRLLRELLGLESRFWVGAPRIYAGERGFRASRQRRDCVVAALAAGVSEAIPITKSTTRGFQQIPSFVCGRRKGPRLKPQPPFRASDAWPKGALSPA